MITDFDTINVDDETLAGIVTFAWQTLGFEECAPAAPLPIADALSATISIGGAWTATLVVSVDMTLAYRFADGLLDLGDELVREDVEDALGELANVVGGNVKGLVDDPAATLSLPVVAHGEPTIAGGQIRVSCAFEAEGLPMVWRLYEPA